MYKLKLYIIGGTMKSQQAIDNLGTLLRDKFEEEYSLEVIDVLKKPGLAENEKILATPTLIKELPLPIRRVIGDLSDMDKVLLGLDIVPSP